MFNDKKALPVDYYNINNNQSTLDKGLKINYDNDGKDTPFRYNLIHDMYLYGIDRVATSLESGEFGISGSEISGDAYILPDTITPYPGDIFSINMMYVSSCNNYFSSFFRSINYFFNIFINLFCYIVTY